MKNTIELFVFGEINSTNQSEGKSFGALEVSLSLYLSHSWLTPGHKQKLTSFEKLTKLSDLGPGSRSKHFDF